MNSFDTLEILKIDGKEYRYFSLPRLEKVTGVDLSNYPYSTRILLENLLRNEDGVVTSKKDIEVLLRQDPMIPSAQEIQFIPTRVLLQDFTGVPVVADLAAMRDGMISRGGNPEKVNPLCPVDLVIDHSVQMDFYASKDALRKNMEFEFSRNGERYRFLKWGQKAFKNFRVVPPGAGICHQVNLEYLSHVAMTKDVEGVTYIFPDTLVGTDSHTTMINGLGILGWGVGGIEAEAAMLGQPCTMLIPEVIGFELTGRFRAGVTATDLVLTITEILRKKGVVGKFVEYFGEGVSNLSIADRATVSNMSPEYGATIGIFPVDEKVITYLVATNRVEKSLVVEKYFKAQNLFGIERREVKFSDKVRLDLSWVEPSMSGPSRPQDRTSLSKVRSTFRSFLKNRYKESLFTYDSEKIQEWQEMSESMKSISFDKATFTANKDLGPLEANESVQLKDSSFYLTHGTIVIASITSCTNTSNPQLMLGAALLARNAVQKGLKSRPWVKTSFAPGSVTVRDYLEASNLLGYLEKLGFHIAGFGCATCIGNSGPLLPEIQAAIEKSGIATVAVLSGNRNFEARIHPFVMANYLASPLLVVASAIAGDINIDLEKDVLGFDQENKGVYLKDIWPDPEELQDLESRFVTASIFSKVYQDVFKGEKNWKEMEVPRGSTYVWNESSSYIKQPPFLSSEMSVGQKEILGARILGIFGDSITTDHISPAGSISPKSPAGLYLKEQNIDISNFNSYGSRRGNHEVMIRGTFANVRLKNKMVEVEGGFTKIFPSGQVTTIYEAAEYYQKKNTPLVVFAGKEYGSGSSRDWAAKGPRLLGVKAVIAESFERIHRSNLVGMGVLPLQLEMSLSDLNLTGEETIDFPELQNLSPKQSLALRIKSEGGERVVFVTVRIETKNELSYFQWGGILPFMLQRLRD